MTSPPGVSTVREVLVSASSPLQLYNAVSFDHFDFVGTNILND
jgi:hypothetical protein